MRSQNIPAMGARYWAALSLASVFGANLGDFVSHDLHLGHIKGVPILAAAFVLVLGAERRWPSQAWYWLAIVLMRTAATNLADLATHDLDWPYPAVMAGLAALLAGFVALGMPGMAGKPVVDGWYFAAMLTAGTLGTAIGDYLGGDLGFGSGWSSLILSAIFATLLLLTARTGWLNKQAYWSVVVAARSAGTSVGDFIPFRHGLNIGLPLSTALSGAALICLLAAWQQSPPPRPQGGL